MSLENKKKRVRCCGVEYRLCSGTSNVRVYLGYLLLMKKWENTMELWFSLTEGKYWRGLKNS